VEVPWVCGNCRSINPGGTTRCYSCRAPQALAVEADSRGVATRIDDRAAPVDQAKLAVRGGAVYRSSAGRALVIQLLVMVVTVITLVQIVLTDAAIVQFSDATTADLPDLINASKTLLLLLGAEVVAWLIAFVAWGAWLSRVVSNVPALGGGFPKSTPDSAFVSSVVPGYNLYSATSILRDAMTRLSEAGKARVGLLTAWWIFLLLAILPIVGLIPGPVFLIRLGYRILISLVVGIVATITHSEISADLVASIVNGMLLVIAAALAIIVISHVESLQEARAPIAEAAKGAAGANAG
jgi:Domain of unknown function (DUF4328)